MYDAKDLEYKDKTNENNLKYSCICEKSYFVSQAKRNDLFNCKSSHVPYEHLF
ncbi:hypothetical protein [Hathewaya limosa]|uniref:Uncharacterized protein n=1 Tax=Hathewaya limosa TaxID=1536 RepID=A0ABU0JWT7_HATLI|nr:hypothetical protein [Hathewaya limosa]MDQ0480608.1 hypothetical protein [Hathewaya limosa]